jgi:hypothetical protein
MTKRSFLALFVILCLFGAFLRSWNFWYFPVGGETQDEMAWSLLGSSLVQTGRPVSWSYFAGYEKVGELSAGENGAVFPLVAPALDHPPLFSLIPGVTLSILGKSWDQLPSLKLVRAPMVVLAVINLMLFAFWQWRRGVSVNEKGLALLLFATLPAVVFLSRLVVAENLLVSVLLVGLTLLTFAKEHWRKYAWFVLLASLPLIKVAGIPVALGFITVLWLQRAEKNNKGLWLWASGGLLAGILGWIGYSAFYDLGLFLQVQSQQAARDTGLLTLISSQLLSFTLVEKVFADPWLVISWVSAFVWFSQKEQSTEDRTVSLLFMSQTAFLFLSVGEHTVHGWYRIPLWPLFTVMLARWISEIWERRNWLSLAWLWLWMASLLRLTVFQIFDNLMFTWQSMLSKLWLLIAGGFVGASLIEMKKKLSDKVWLWMALAGFFVLIVCHTAIIMRIEHQRYWEDVLYWEQGLRP